MTLLLGDHEPAVHAALRNLCRALDVALISCTDGAAALYQAGRHHPDVVLLSVDLPVLSAPQVISVLRSHLDTDTATGTAPRIVLGIGDGEADSAATGIAAGATEVISRPYQRRDLQTLLDHQLSRGQTRRDENAVLVLGDLELDSAGYTAHRGPHRLDLTVREFELLRLLMLQADRVVTPEKIRKDLWGAESPSGNTIAVHIRRIRNHLAGSATEIVSVRGVGYRLTSLAQARELA